MLAVFCNIETMLLFSTAIKYGLKIDATMLLFLTATKYGLKINATMLIISNNDVRYRGSKGVIKIQCVISRL